VARDLLADTKIRQAQPRQKAYRLHDGAGLYLHVQTNGSKYWRLKFRYHTAKKESLRSVSIQTLGWLRHVLKQ
jgi:hypothetical protein